MSDAAGYLLQGSELLFTNVHQITASPWYVSIPLVAIITSATIRAPLNLWSLGTARRKARLTPLIQAQTAMGLRKKNRLDALDIVSKSSQKAAKQIYANFGQNNRGVFLSGLLSLPVFVSNIQVLWRMCGGQQGILGRLMFGSQTMNDKITTTPASATATAQSNESGELMVSEYSNVQETITLEPILANGGCLWFPNLLEADPYHVLPFAVSAVMMLNIMPWNIAGIRGLLGLSGPEGQIAISTTSKTARALQRAMFLLSLLLGPLTMDMPAAIHLYWISSATTTLLISKGLKKLMPIPQGSITPCRGMDMPILRPKAPTLPRSA